MSSAQAEMCSQPVDNRRVRLHELFLTWKLDEHLKNGVVRKQVHPTLPLTIYTYTDLAQINGMWDSCSNECRGLIVDNDGIVVARPFRKFHNLNTNSIPETREEWLTSVANVHFGEPEVTQKLDGSLGIGYYYDGKWAIATRGSFASEQAQWATNWLRNLPHKEFIEDRFTWADGWTPLFEIIYPDNRIVVHYDFAGLVLIGSVNNRTGQEMTRGELEYWAKLNEIPIVKKFDKSIEQCKAENTPNEEGYVLTWHRPGYFPLKVKVKFEEYCRLHRVVTNLSAKDVWEMLRDDKRKELFDLLSGSYPRSFQELAQRYHSKDSAGSVRSA